MKNYFNYLLIGVFSFLLFSCGGESAQEKNKKALDSVSGPVSDRVNDPVTYHSVPDSLLGGNPIKYDTRKVIDKVYITNRPGAKGREQASHDGREIAEYGYGGLVEVIEISGDWYGISDRITRDFNRDGQKIEVTRWEKVYILKSETGEADSVALNWIELNSCYVTELNGERIMPPYESESPELFHLELVSEAEYNYQKSVSVKKLVQDSSGVIQKNRDVTLKLKEGTKVYRRIDKGDEVEEYTFKGVIPSLDAYLLRGDYYENHGFILVDKNTGKELVKMGDFPAISSTNKYIASIQANPYNGSGDLELYIIQSKNIKHVISVSFDKWMPVIDDENIFWGNDKTLYIKLNHVGVFWVESGSQNENGQYAKLILK